MGRHRRSSVARAVAIASTTVAAIVLAIDFTDPIPRWNVPAVCLIVIAAATWLAWLIIHTHEIADATALANQEVRQQHAEQRLRGLRSNADSDH